MTFITQDEIARSVFAVASWAELSDTDRRIVTPIHTGVEAAIRVWLGGNTSLTTRTEILTSPPRSVPTNIVPMPQINNDSDILYLQFNPVTVSSVVVSEQRYRQDAWTNDHILTAGTHYQIEDVISGISSTGLLRRIGDTWPTAPGAVKVTYTGGRSQAASPDQWELIKMATLEAVRAHYQTAKRAFGAQGSATGPVSGENFGTYSYTVDTQAAVSQGLSGSSQGGITPAAEAILWALHDPASFI